MSVNKPFSRGCRRAEKLMETAGKIAEDVVEKFQQEWEPLMENVKEAAETFDNLEGI